MNPATAVSQPDRTYIDAHPNTWSEAKNFASQISGWVFRGERSNTWHLDTTLARAYKRSGIAKDIHHVERATIEKFKRRSHHFISTPPDKENTLEWLAMIQHHGGPTRLMDFTRSFYIASFFAVEGADSDASFWCLNVDLLRKTSRELLSRIWNDGLDAEDVCTRLIDSGQDVSAICAVEPYRLNERSAAQQGLFVMPCTLMAGMHDCLFGMLDQEGLSVPRYDYDIAHLQLGSFPYARKTAKINIPQSIHAEVKRDLLSMNIHPGSLFPGLDGFARSLHWLA